MIIVEHFIDGPILKHAMEHAPDTTVFLQHQSASPDGPIRLVFWARGDDLEGFEAAMEDDPTIADVVRLVETETHALHRVDLTHQGKEKTTMDAWMNCDGIFEGAVRTLNGWETRMRFPDRDSLAKFRSYCNDQEMSFQVKSIYTEHHTQVGEQFGLTPNQLDTLLTAFELGYFSIPRDASLNDVADELGVSDQAASERLRRGMEALIMNSIHQSHLDNDAELLETPSIQED